MWIRKRSVVLTAGVTSLAGLLYSWHTTNKHLAALISLFSFGGACLHRRFASRNMLNSNHVVVVTGCDSGLGYSLALYCRFLGATVVAGVLEETGQGAELLKKQDVVVLPLDITNEKSIRNFGDALLLMLERRQLKLAALVNNAGVMVFGEFEWQTEDQVRHQVEVNLLGTMRITRQLMPLIRKDSSRIVVVSSHCASEPLPGLAAYSATKAAINAWATAIRVELEKYGIDVVSFVPGSFTQQSNILARQSRYFDAMKSAMSEEARNFYGDYFDRYINYLLPLAQKISPRAVENPQIYETFEGALLDRYPSIMYKCEPWRYFFYYTLFKITPSYVRDRLVVKFIRLPNWRGKIVDKRSSMIDNALPTKIDNFENNSSRMTASDSENKFFEDLSESFSLLSESRVT